MTLQPFVKTTQPIYKVLKYSYQLLHQSNSLATDAFNILILKTNTRATRYCVSYTQDASLRDSNYPKFFFSAARRTGPTIHPARRALTSRARRKNDPSISKWLPAVDSGFRARGRDKSIHRGKVTSRMPPVGSYLQGSGSRKKRRKKKERSQTKRPQHTREMAELSTLYILSCCSHYSKTSHESKNAVLSPQSRCTHNVLLYRVALDDLHPEWGGYRIISTLVTLVGQKPHHLFFFFGGGGGRQRTRILSSSPPKNGTCCSPDKPVNAVVSHLRSDILGSLTILFKNSRYLWVYLETGD